MPTASPQLRRRRLKIVAGIFSALFVFWLLFCSLAVYSLTRRSRVRSSEPIPQSSKTIEELRLVTADGEDIGAWYAAGERGKPTVLLIHGNGGQRRACWPQAEMLIDAGYPVMLITCRAHGDSSGQINDFGWSAKQDVIAAVKWLAIRNPRPQVVVWGASLGSAAAIFAAAELDQSACGYILECPYQDLETAVWHRLEHYLPPILDGVAYLGMRLSAGAILPQIAQISPLNHIETIPRHVPILILAGGVDQRARPAEARALQSRVSSHCQLEIIERGDHLQLQRAAPQEYEKLIMKFLDQIVTSKGPN